MFFDNLVQMEENEHCLLSAWSNSEVNVKLAVATNKPRIIFMNDEGTIEPNFEITRGKNQITQMKWHPTIHALAIGWSDGCLTLWQEDDRLIRDEKVSVFSALARMQYSNLNLLFVLECPSRPNHYAHLQFRWVPPCLRRRQRHDWSMEDAPWHDSRLLVLAPRSHHADRLLLPHDQPGPQC